MNVKLRVGLVRYLVLGCVRIPLLVGTNSEWGCAGGSCSGIMGDRSCEVWFEFCFGHGVPHSGCQGRACGGSNVIGMG